MLEVVNTQRWLGGLWASINIIAISNVAAILAPIAENGLGTNFKSNYEIISEPKELTGSEASSSYFKPLQHSHRQPQPKTDNLFYERGEEGWKNDNNYNSLFRQEAGNAFGHNIKTNNMYYKKYNIDRNYNYDNSENNYNKNNNYENTKNYNVVEVATDGQNDYRINNENYPNFADIIEDAKIIATKTATNISEIPHYQQNLHIRGNVNNDPVVFEPNYYENNLWQQQQPEQQEYMHEQYSGYLQQKRQQNAAELYKNNESRANLLEHVPMTTIEYYRTAANTNSKGDAETSVISPNAADNEAYFQSNSYALKMPLGSNNVKTNYDQILHQHLQLQLKQQHQQQQQQSTYKPHLTTTTTTITPVLSNSNRELFESRLHLRPHKHIVRYNALSVDASAGIPLARHVDVIKSPKVVSSYQRLFMPYNQSVHIEVPQPMISTEKQPLPINVPVPRTTVVADMRELRIPIEKLQPYAVERPIPFIVERRVPYHVERQIPVPHYYPYPIRVPMVKTVIHKIPSHDSHRYIQLQQNYHQQQPFTLRKFKSSNLI